MPHWNRDHDSAANQPGAPPGSIPGTYTLNSQGYAEDQYIQLSGGTYNLAASYAGDNSYNPSTSSDTVTITKAPTTITLSAPSSNVGTNVNIAVTINTQSYGPAQQAQCSS